MTHSTQLLSKIEDMMDTLGMPKPEYRPYKPSDRMSSEEINRAAQKQGVSKSCIYNRLARNWGLDEIHNGYKVGTSPYRKVTSKRYDMSCGNTSFMVLLFDVIKSITKLDDIDNYPLTVNVFYGLLNRKEMPC